MRLSIFSDDPPNQPYPSHVESGNERKVGAQAKQSGVWVICPQPPSQIQNGRRAIHEEELHDNIDAAVPVLMDVVVEDEQGKGDTNMMSQEGFVGVL